MYKVSHIAWHVSCDTCHMSCVTRGPKSLSRWELNPGQTEISLTNLDGNHVLKSKNNARNDQEECLINTQTDT